MVRKDIYWPENDLSFIRVYLLCLFPPTKADKESMRALKSQPGGYEVTFTLLNPRPDDIRVSWDIQSAIDSKYLEISHK